MMNRMKRIISLTFGLVMALTMSAQDDVQFPFPQIPELLQTPEARLGYLMEHYWSRYDFSDNTERGQAVAEQGFADYVNLMQYADSATCALSARVLADSISRSQSRLEQFDGLVDHYLGNPNSPLRNDVTYAHLLRAFSALPQLDEARRSRMAFRLRMVERNQPGTLAADFTFIDREGREHRLYDVDSELTLIVFSDPECDHCHEQMPRIMGSRVLTQDARLRVLNIYPDHNAEAWLKDVKPLPQNWLEGRSPEGLIIREQTYYLPALPSLYLLDRQKRVVVKDGTIEQVEAVLSHQ